MLPSMSPNFCVGAQAMRRDSQKGGEPVLQRQLRAGSLARICRRLAAASIACAFFATACAPQPAPDLLAGAWGRSEAACRAGVIARFDPDAVRLVFDDEPQVLLARPRYAMDESGRITIRFATPDGGGEGIVVLDGAEEGRLRLVARRYLDQRTGAMAATLDPQDDALAVTLSLVRCSGAVEGAKIRGRS